MRVSVLFVVAALASCGGASPNRAPTTASAATTASAGRATAGCSSFAGKPVTAATFADPCAVDAATTDMLNTPVGQLFVAGTARTSCEDGRVLIWNDLGWGYESEPFNAFHEGGIDGQYVAPHAERDRCAANG